MTNQNATITFAPSEAFTNRWNVEVKGEYVGAIVRERLGQYGKTVCEFRPSEPGAGVWGQRLSHASLPKLRAILQTQAEA